MALELYWLGTTSYSAMFSCDVFTIEVSSDESRSTMSSAKSRSCSVLSGCVCIPVSKFCDFQHVVEYNDEDERR